MDRITIVDELVDGTTSSIEAATDFLQRRYALAAGGILPALRPADGSPSELERSG